VLSFSHTQGELTVGTLGRAHTFDAVAAEQGFGTVHSVAYSKGAFVGLSVEGSIVGARKKVNATFYGDSSPTLSKDILSGKVQVPDDKDTVLSEVYAKLKTLSTALSVSAPAMAEMGGAEEEKDIAVEG